MQRLPCLVLVGVLAACGGPTHPRPAAPRPTAPAPTAPAPTTPTPTAPAPTAPAPTATWACPAGTSFAGELGVEAWCARPDGTRHGPYAGWTARGDLASEGAYADGLQDGRWVEYFEGRPSGEGPYRRGKKHGVWRHQGDHFELEETWRDGVLIESVEFVRDPEPAFDPRDL